MDDIQIRVYVADWRDVPANFNTRDEILTKIAKAAIFAAEREAERLNIAARVSVADPD
jgi:hypothetical protein